MVSFPGLAGEPEHGHVAAALLGGRVPQPRDPNIVRQPAICAASFAPRSRLLWYQRASTNCNIMPTISRHFALATASGLLMAPGGPKLSACCSEAFWAYDRLVEPRGV